MFGQQILTTFLQSAPCSLCKMTGKRRFAGIDDVDYLTGAGGVLPVMLPTCENGFEIWVPYGYPYGILGGIPSQIFMGILRKSWIINHRREYHPDVMGVSLVIHPMKNWTNPSDFASVPHLATSLEECCWDFSTYPNRKSAKISCHCTLISRQNSLVLVY